MLQKTLKDEEPSHPLTLTAHFSDVNPDSQRASPAYYEPVSPFRPPAHVDVLT